MTTSRIQLALNVRDIEAATTFYADMFGVPPAKQRPGYANFVVADPPLKLVLFENAGRPSRAQPPRSGGRLERRRRRGHPPLRRRRPGAHHRRGRRVLPRRPGQGVGRGTGRTARRLGVLHRAGR